MTPREVPGEVWVTVSPYGEPSVAGRTESIAYDWTDDGRQGTVHRYMLATALDAERERIRGEEREACAKAVVGVTMAANVRGKWCYVDDATGAIRAHGKDAGQSVAADLEPGATAGPRPVVMSTPAAKPRDREGREVSIGDFVGQGPALFPIVGLKKFPGDDDSMFAETPHNGCFNLAFSETVAPPVRRPRPAPSEPARETAYWVLRYLSTPREGEFWALDGTSKRQCEARRFDSRIKAARYAGSRHWRPVRVTRRVQAVTAFDPEAVRAKWQCSGCSTRFESYRQLCPMCGKREYFCGSVNQSLGLFMSDADIARKEKSE